MSDKTEVIEGEVVDTTTGEVLGPEDPKDSEGAIERVEPAGPVNLYGTNDPAVVMDKASHQADVLMRVVKEKQLSQRFGRSQKEYLMVEAWTFLGTMVGLYPVVVWTRELDAGVGWEARVEVQTMGGQIVGAAEAMVTRSERNWKDRDPYALRSMAQTRATSKALRGPLSFVAVLAGFESLSAEEAAVERARRKRKTEAEKAEEPLLTQAQLRKLMVVARRLKWDDDERHRRAGVESFKDLTLDRASELIEEWDALEASGEEKAPEGTPEEPVPPATGDEEPGPDPSVAPAPTPNADEPATNEQFARAQELGLTKAKLVRRGKERFGVTSQLDLTQGQLQELIDEEESRE